MTKYYHQDIDQRDVHYPDPIPSVERHEEPLSIHEMEEAGIYHGFVPLLDLLFWEGRGFKRAHSIGTAVKEDEDERCYVCIYDRVAWSDYIGNGKDEYL